MRWSFFWTLIFLLLHCSETIAAPVLDYGQYEVEEIATLDRRADNEATTTATNAATSQTSTASATDTHTESAKTTVAVTTTTETKSSTTSKASHSTSIATTIPSLDGSTASSDQASQNGTKSVYTGGLPIKPVITPALGVGGFILLILGAAQAFIGIRKQSIYIFLSTAFLAALGVTVLIVYVMNPPVTNAVQGGYLVAVFFTGVIFGGLALVFREITEGLGCLLGGFCIGMWFLTVKSGGIVTGSTARAGFIIAFTVGFYCLSFSQYTRSYGLMLCTAFSGATVLVLGIDCYSRAGLKEFWLYVWGLNDDMFPLHTNTYPVTRDIRVELAIIIIVTVFGVIAQLRLWKVIKERRAKEEISRKEAQQKDEEAETEVARQLEEKNLRERAEWEQMYGNGVDAKAASMTETAVAEDSRRGSEGFESSGNEKGDSFEMKDMPAGSHAASPIEGGRVEEAVPETVNEEQEGPTHPAADTLEQHPPASEQHTEHTEQTEPRPTSLVSRHTLHLDQTLREDNDSEHGAVLGSEPGSPRSKRLSGRSLLNRLSWRSANVPKNAPQSQSEEALVVLDDTNSSIAGVVDDISSGCPSIVSDIYADAENETEQENKETKSLQKKNILAEVTEAGLNSQSRNIELSADVLQEESQPSHGQHDVNEAERAQQNSEFQIHEDNASNENQVNAEESNSHDESPPSKPDNITLRVTSDPQTEPPADKEPKLAASVEEVNRVKEDSTATELPVKETTIAGDVPGEVDGDPQQPDTDSVSQSTPPSKMESARLDVSTVKNIPAQTSKIVHSFRTNEWAKHLADAELPDVEPITLDYEINAVEGDAEEAPAPVDIQSLMQTPMNAHPPPATSSFNETPESPEQVRRSSHTSGAGFTEASRSKSRNSFQSILGAKSPAPLSRNVSSASLVPRQEHDERSGQPRSPSTPFLTITAPHEGQEVTDSPRWSGPAPLLAVRENMVRNRMSSTSLRFDPYISRSQSRQSLADPFPMASPPLSIPEERDEDLDVTSAGDEDDLPLSQRRAMLQQKTFQSPSLASLQSLEPAHSSQHTTAETGRNAAVMAAWRHSVREEISQKRDPLAFNSPPLGASSPERPRSLWGSMQQMREASATQVGNAIADGMQRGSMTDLHRQAMRRMQASANRKL
ncbi:hypothetical protein N7462_003781 [Penicillium macrosclerotiorum]|uniref:uncharacterized protein n=1 Tax=Penicillium macrosclerotiorum TaxID=303699 RepID=UPI0025496D0C|nr:uncharacterized protein N7462_003781 [Penicillium macrosclerotiorum]KAJ5689389.1 hypothetical protein N7462_003781 [Penicillium macrosclerotiorum]